MDKNAIIQVIKDHPEMDKEALRTQALSAGVEEAAFEEAWNEVQSGAASGEAAATPTPQEAEVPASSQENKKEGEEGGKPMGKNNRLGLILRWVFKNLGKNIKLYLLILLLLLPLDIYLASDPVGSTLTVGEPINLQTFLTPIALVGLLGALLAFFLNLVAIVSIRFEKEGQKKTIGNILSFSATKFLPQLGTAIMMGVFLIGLLMLLVIPGVIFSVYWAFALAIVVFENQSGFQALKSSKALVKGRWAATLADLILLGLGIMVIAFLFSYVVGALGVLLATELPAGAAFYVTGTMNTIMRLLSIFGTLTMTYLYLEMKRTREFHKN